MLGFQLKRTYEYLQIQRDIRAVVKTARHIQGHVSCPMGRRVGRALLNWGIGTIVPHNQSKKKVKKSRR